MVRKWSYLNKYEYNLSRDFGYFKSVVKFRVFKKTTRFKKAVNTRITYMFRKKYSKRKRRTNWISMLYITFEWSNFFMRSKQFIRFYQNLGLFNYQTFSPSAKYMHTMAREGFIVNPLNTFSCSKDIILKFSLESKNINYLSSPFSGGPSVGCYSSEYKKDSIVDIPGIVVRDNLMYEQFIELPGHDLYEGLYLDIDKVFYESIISYIICIYSINIYITIKNTN